jgi:hypothetical protein
MLHNSRLMLGRSRTSVNGTKEVRCAKVGENVYFLELHTAWDQEWQREQVAGVLCAGKIGVVVSEP